MKTPTFVFPSPFQSPVTCTAPGKPNPKLWSMAGFQEPSPSTSSSQAPSRKTPTLALVPEPPEPVPTVRVIGIVIAMEPALTTIWPV